MNNSLSCRSLLVLIAVIMMLSSMSQAQIPGLCMYRVPEKRSLYDCQWYNSERSCCTVEDSQQIKNSWEGATGKYENATVTQFVTKVLTSTIFAQCVNQLHMFVCFHCTPNQLSYVNIFDTLITRTVNLNVCRSYCDSMYHSCKLLPIGDKKLVKDTYSNADDFCTDFLSPMVSNYKLQIKDTGTCFNSANSLKRSISLVGIISMATVALFAFLL